MSLYISELHSIKKTFESLDHNFNGFMTIEEIKYTLKGVFCQDDVQVFSELFTQMEATDIGEIKYSEFVSMAIDRQKFI